MMYRIYYGELSEARRKNWENGEENPYTVLLENKEIRGCDWVSFLAIAREVLHDEIQIDWGSFAWKGNKEDLLNLKKRWHAKIQEEKSLREDVEYGIVFIEEC